MTPRTGEPADEPKGVPLFTMADLRAMFDGASEDDLRSLAEDLAPYTYATLNARIQGDTRDDRKIRVTDDGADVKSTAAGTQVKFPGESYFDHLNFKNATLSVESSISGRRVNIQSSGGGADCMFDYLVSSCFASLTGFTEGKTFTSLSGCTFIGYSTIGGALTAMAALSASTHRVLFICGGTYEEQVTQTPPIGANWDIYGAGSGRVNWATTAVSQTLLNFGTTSSGSRIRIRGINFDVGHASCVGLTSAGNWIGSVIECHFTITDSTGKGATVTNALGGTFDDCTFTGSGIGFQPSTAQLTTFTGCVFTCGTGMSLNGNRVQLNGCIFNCSTKDIVFGVNAFEISISGANEFNKGISCTAGGQLDNLTFTGNTLRLGAGEIGLDFSALTTNSSGFMIGGNSFKGSSTAIGIKLDANMVDGMIGPNTFVGFTTGNEITATGGGVTGAHNVSDAGAIADFGSPVGHNVAGTSGVTGGDAHDHVGGDGAQIDHGGLAGLTDDDHTQYVLESAHASPSYDAGHHAAVTLGADAGAVLGLTGQQIDLDTQTANTVFAGPTTGAAADPTFRALVSDDLPATVVETGDAAWIDLTDGGATTLHSHAGGSGHTVRENGTDQTARTGLNFVDTDAGAGLITDDAGGNETEVNLGLYRLESQDHSHASTGLQGGIVAAASISIADAGGDFTATTVEGALDELQADNEALAASLRSIMLLAGAPLYPTSSAGCSLPTRVEYGASNKLNDWVLDFDTTTEENAFARVILPANYVSETFTAIVQWTAAVGTAAQTVQWKVALVAPADNSALDVAYGTAQVISDALQTVNYMHISGSTPAITCAGSPGPGKVMYVRVTRDVANDNLSGDVRLISVKLAF